MLFVFNWQHWFCLVYPEILGDKLILLPNGWGRLSSNSRKEERKFKNVWEKTFRNEQSWGYKRNVLNQLRNLKYNRTSGYILWFLFLFPTLELEHEFLVFFFPNSKKEKHIPPDRVGRGRCTGGGGRWCFWPFRKQCTRNSWFSFDFTIWATQPALGSQIGSKWWRINSSFVKSSFIFLLYYEMPMFGWK